MSRSWKKVSQHYICCVNHRAESKHFKQRRRQYRRILNHYVRTHWHDEDMILPSHLRLYEKWNAPSDGSYVEFCPPAFENPYDHHTHFMYTSTGSNLFNINNWTKHKLPKKSEVELYIAALKTDYENLQYYKKSFRK